MTYAHKQQAIARESGKSFQSVVKDYADQGHSIHGTAVMLDYSQAAFRRLCIRHGWCEWFAKQQDSVLAKEARKSRRGSDTSALKAAREKRGYPTVTYQGITDNYAAHARRLGISVSTLYKRKDRRPGDLEYIFAVRSHVRPPDNSNHKWRKDDGR